ncbi:MAG TPA: metal ABC transporter permease [Acidimicrobiales bacterium]|nr:metal ABC transporter permease [Acidimicrobiales bacterium]
MSILHAIFQPGLFSNSSVQDAAVLGAVVALVCAPVGVFTVVRGQSFAGHAFADITATGGSAAFLLGVSPLLGFVVMALAGASATELLGAERQRGRDLVTGVVLGSGLGLSALLLYLTTTTQSTTGAAVTVLFGSIFAVSSSTLPLVIGFGASALVLVGLVYRPLLLSSINPDLASAQGPGLRAVGLVYMVSLALSVALSALTIGAILSTALLIGPAAAALRLAKSPGRAIAYAAVIGVAATWAGIVLAYDSYNWPPAQQGWPVSFFVVSLVLAAYLLSQLANRPARRA